MLTILPTAADVAAFATALFDDYALTHDAPGIAILAARGDDLLYEGARGLASVELGVPLTSSHIFPIASVGKQVVAATLLDLVAKGKVALDDPLARFLPDFPNGTGIPISQLLDHTNGVMSYTDAPGFWTTPPPLFVTTAQLVATIAALPPAFAPGTSWAYNNSGYVLAGAVIEAASGMPWHTYMTDVVLRPHGIDGIWHPTDLRVIPNLVAGHGTDHEGRTVRAFPPMFATAHGAGGLVGDVRSLWRWNRALHGGAMLPADLYRRMTTPEGAAAAPGPDGAPSPAYGLGITTGRVNGVGTMRHSGSIHGVATIVFWAPETATTVVALANTDDPSTMIDAITRRLLAFATGHPYPSPVAVAMPDSASEGLVGVCVRGTDRVEVVAEGAGLHLSCAPSMAVMLRGGRGRPGWSGQDTAPSVAVPLVHLGNDRFAVSGGFSRLTFTRDASGRATGFAYRSDGDLGEAVPWVVVDGVA
jgi:CubicO group peptidase (beta-lactamase class C family)